MLNQDSARQKELKLTQYPEIYINGFKYKGSLDKNDLLFSICSYLNEDNPHCLELDIFDEEKFIDEIKHLFLLFLIGLIVIGLGIKIYTQRKFNQEMQLRIN
jgi:hypothetical protein